MAEPDFERQLVGLFAEVPSMPDGEAFARRVERRLDQGWRLRRTMIGGLGALGGLIFAGQVAASSVQMREENIRLPDWSSMTQELSASLGGSAMSANALFMAVGLAAVAVAFALPRLVRAI